MTELFDPHNEIEGEDGNDYSDPPKVPEPQTGEDLFTVIAHDLRDPVSSIKMLSGFIRDELRKNNHAEVTALFDLLYTQVEFTEYLLNDLLAWGRARTKKIPFQPAHQVVINVFNELINLNSFSIQNKAIVLETHVSPQLRVYADHNILNTILRNLLTNAIKFSFQNGKIILSAYSQAGKVIIQVQDEGRGITPSILDKLLKESIVSTPGTNNENGTGLGLLICKEYLKIHGGSLRVDSEAGKGTLITLTFPGP